MSVLGIEIYPENGLPLECQAELPPLMEPLPAPPPPLPTSPPAAPLALSSVDMLALMMNKNRDLQ